MRALDRTIFRKRSIVESMRRIFSPKSLFSTGAQGVWYDPSDLTTLFEDAAGTIPITSPLGKPVGLMLDKSRGLVLGPELVTNGDFSNGTASWSSTSFASTASVVNGEFRVTATAAYGGKMQAISCVVGKTYKITGSVRSLDGSSFAIRVGIQSNGTVTGAPSGFIETSSSTAITGSFYFTATQTTMYVLLFSTSGVSGKLGAFNSISVRELPGNHAYQSTTTSRPTLSARYNLLTKTEALTDAAWTKQAGTTVNASPVADPNGALNAWFVTGNGTSGIYQAILGTVSLGQSTRSVYLRVQSGTATIGLTDPALSQGTTTCNVTTTWQRFTLTETTSPTAAYVGGLFLRNIPVGGIEVAWPDVRPTNDGIGLPAYQRVNTATDYDYAGFPPYLKFDGTDDSMATGNIDFTGTDKMSVFAGVRKLSDAARGVVVELSTTTANNGTFGLDAPVSAAANFATGSRGTSNAGAIASGYAAPITVVTASLLGISTNQAVLRINGGQIASDSTSQGTGNYGNYPLYIGRRGGTTLPFNGRIYSLVVCGKLASAAEISSTEAYINNKTKAY